MRSLIGSIVDRPRNLAPVPLASRAASIGGGLFAGRSRTSQTAQLDAYGNLGILFGIVNRTATSTATAEWRLWRKAPSGRKEDRTEVTSHAAIDLWNRPSTLTVDGGRKIAVATSREFVEASQQHMDLVGEMWWLVSRSSRYRGLPLELWVVRPDRMRPVPHAERYLAGYIYTSPDGEEVPLALDEVIFTRMPHPTDPYRGCGPVQALLTSIDSVRYSEEWNRNFFINSAEPGGVVEIDKRLSDDEWDEFNARWRASHRGVANAHRVAMLEHGARWVPRAFSQRDMQFAELAGVGDAKIRQAYSIPKFALGDVTDVNRATADASQTWFARELTVPRLDRLKDTLNHRLLPLFGATAEGLEWDYETPVPEDEEAEDRERTSKAAAAKALVDAGYDGASVAQALELPDALVWRPPAQAIATAGAKRNLEGGLEVAAPKPGSPAALAGGWLRDAVAQAEPVEPEQPEPQDWELLLAALLAAWAATVTPAQIAELGAQVLAAVGAGTAAALAELAVTTTEAAALLGDAMVEQAAAGSARMVQAAAAAGQHAPARVDVDEQPLRDAAEVTADLLGRGLATAAGREALRVWGPGASSREVADAVTQHLEGLSDASLRTELGGAVWRAEHAGRVAALRELPAATYYAAESNDRNVCGPCDEVDGTAYDTLPAALADYPAGGYRLCAGGVRCRGEIIARWE